MHLLELYAPCFAAVGYMVQTWGESEGKPVSVPDEPMLTEPGERTIRVRFIREVGDPSIT